jgi:hypothetical protein
MIPEIYDLARNKKNKQNGQQSRKRPMRMTSNSKKLMMVLMRRELR